MNPQVFVLIADDDSKTCKSLKMLLEAMGYYVDTTGDGEQAVLKCKERHPDIAFTDIQMPDTGCFELLSLIRGLSRKTAVVIISGCGTVARAVEAMKLGAVEFVEKPFDPDRIRLLCQEILQRQKLEGGGSVDEFLNLTKLARSRNARIEARLYLKNAMVRDVTRPEPYYELGDLYENEGDVRQAVHYYYLALDARNQFPPARDALKRLGYLKT
ncbi:MAG: response regulator [Candidatus Binatia bacterium]